MNFHFDSISTNGSALLYSEMQQKLPKLFTSRSQILKFEPHNSSYDFGYLRLDFGSPFNI